MTAAVDPAFIDQVSMDQVPIDEVSIDKAIEWSIKLASGAATLEDRAECEYWRAAHINHERAWQQVQTVERAFSEVPAASEQLAYRVLQASPQISAKGQRRARKAIGALAIIALIIPLAWLMPWQQRTDYHTAIGERGSFALSDGSRLQLNTGSHVTVTFSPLRRHIDLLRGEILIETGRDTNALLGKRRFLVKTREAELEALGTRFGVRQMSKETQLSVTEGRVSIHSDTLPNAIIKPGESVVVTSNVVLATPVTQAALDPTAWVDGVLVAKHMRLDAFVAELSRYRATPIRCDTSIAAVQVSGVFQLNGGDPVTRALDSLAQALPVQIVQGVDGSVQVSKIK